MDDCRSCRSVTERMTRYVDGALAPDERDAVERHLRACPPCRGEAAAQAAGRTALRDGAARLRADAVPPELRARCEAAARAACRARGAALRGRLLPTVVAASLVLATAAAIAWVAVRRSDAVFAAELSEDHLECFGRLPASAAALDAGQVAADLRRRYGWDVHVPSPAGIGGLQLMEGRRCLVATHGGVPHLLYRVNGEEVSLFVFPGVTRDEADLTTADGQRARIWSRGANSFALVSSSRSAGVEQVLALVRQDAQ